MESGWILPHRADGQAFMEQAQPQLQSGRTLHKEQYGVPCPPTWDTLTEQMGQPPKLTDCPHREGCTLLEQTRAPLQNMVQKISRERGKNAQQIRLEEVKRAGGNAPCWEYPTEQVA